MQTAALVQPASETSDPQVVKQWAAEDFALAVGLLRECPFHGQPFKAQTKGVTRKMLAGGLIDPLDPIVQVFNGDTSELLATVERVTRDYGERCVFCAASDLEEDFD
jgi:hypothetical protein